MKYLVSSIIGLALIISSSVFAGQGRPEQAFLIKEDNFTWLCILTELTEENIHLPGAPLNCMKVMTEQLTFGTKCQTTRDYTWPLDCKGQQQEKTEKYTF